MLKYDIEYSNIELRVLSYYSICYNYMLFCLNTPSFLLALLPQL